ncbi:phage tail assembly chaperone [Bradyrhizobium manausense]
MRLAANSFRLQLGSKVYALRPTLRAAFHLHHKHGFPELYRAILDGSYTASMDLIAATSEVMPAASISTILGAREQLLEFVLILSGANANNDKPQSGEFISFEEYIADLYKVGAGHLGWRPDVVWNATPAEILAARDGRMDLLKDILTAVFGSKEQSDDASDVTNIKADLNAIGDLTNHVRAR